MRLLSVLISVVVILVSVGCNTEETLIDNNDIDDSSIIQNETTSYEIYYETFEVLDEINDTDVLIQYPQITGLDTLEIEINSLLKEEGVKIYNDNVSDALTLHVEAQVKYLDQNLISVRYAGTQHYHDTMRVNDVLFGTTISLTTGEVVNITDFLNEEFKNQLTRDTFKYAGPEEVLEDVQPNTHHYGYLNADESIITEMLEKYMDEVTHRSFYLTEDSLYLFVLVPSGPSVYLELKAELKDLESCIYEDSVVSTIVRKLVE